ncbi:putative mitochondrial respiratory chain complex I assembly [Lyophyllum shimeji]|uniref:Mitochondrial respiratory chain complex I assembly n=1 Tax=Lyophyllum shimeji TaxID=47721 RepID=A0A9P3PL87_LYOSH|nr:putative mitochondrial respiratory chain complex I assembly [Lyophyllum shimeji]
MTVVKSAVPRQTPLKRFALHTTSTCASQASVYGKCIVANYTDVQKDMCKEEFAQFKRCLRNAMKRKW